MAILLTDIPAAVADYLDNQVTVTVSDVIPDNKKLSPGERGTCTVTVRNAADGLRLMLAQPVQLVCTEHGDVKVTAHIHADVDQGALFPNSRGKNGSGTLIVDF